VDSAPGKGARFDIYLPHAAEEPATQHSEIEDAAIRRGTETILLVEDEESVRELACEFLKSGGYSVLEAANGIDALDLAAKQSRRIDLVLSDVMMPKMTGAVLAERLKTILPQTPVLLMSGYTEYPGSSRMTDSGRAAAVIQKPFTQASLLEAVRDALDRKIVRDTASISETLSKTRI
jgi:CheY-like chemotaxis protein